MKIENIETHLTKIEVGSAEFYVSYETVIAFRDTSTDELVISKNKWSRTTGGHLNKIDSDKSKRIPYDEFEEKLEEFEAKFSI